GLEEGRDEEQLRARAFSGAPLLQRVDGRCCAAIMTAVRAVCLPRARLQGRSSENQPVATALCSLSDLLKKTMAFSRGKAVVPKNNSRSAR
ncbi:MAG: hypothetical protein RIS52_1274, partial [Pseudomonadota bacterium]